MGRKQNYFVNTDDRVPLDRKLTREGALTIVLQRPRIPQNTGAVARLCAATGSRLELIAPFFEIDDAKLKRAGLDYWPLLDVKVFPDNESWFEAHPLAKPWFVEVASPIRYTDVKYSEGDFLFFGDEQDGVSPSLLEKFSDRHVMIPQINVRSMNLAMCVGVVTFEVLRQTAYKQYGDQS